MTITEKQAFESVAESLGWDVAKDDRGNYTNPSTVMIWKGWKWRADIHQVAQIKAGMAVMDRLNQEFRFIDPNGKN